MSIRVDADEPFHVLIGQSVIEMSLDALDDAYHGEVIQDSTLIWQEGLGEWLRLDVVLERLAQQEQDEAALYSAPAAPPTPDQYFVLIGGDEVKQMTLDQLDDAYRLDVIEDSTLIWQPGYPEWIPLSVLLASEQEAPVVGASIYASHDNERIALQHGSQAPAVGYVLGAQADSTRPVSSNILQLSPPDNDPPASPWLKRGLAMAAAAALLLSFHQYGLTHAVAAGLGQGDAFQRALGGHDLRTPHGLELWLAELSQVHGLEQLAATEPVSPPKRAPAQAAAEAPAQAAAADAPEPAAPSTVPSGPAEEPAAAPPASDLPAHEPGAVNDSLLGKKKPAAAAPRAKSKSTTSAPRGSGLAYDPMNGAL